MLAFSVTPKYFSFTVLLRIVPPMSQRGAVSPVVGRSLITRPARVQFPGLEAIIIRCKTWLSTLYIRDCESLCLSDATIKAVGPFYMVSMPGEVKYPTQGVNV